MACGSGCCASPPTQDSVQGKTSHAEGSGAVASNVQPASAVNKEFEAQGKCRDGVSVDPESCQDGCCGDKEAVEKDACDDGCCEEADGDGCCKEDTCQDACCIEDKLSTTAKDHPNADCQDGCCGEEQTFQVSVEESAAACEDACCSSNKTPPKEVDAPACCAGKSSPCCDVSCLDRLADRECKEQGTIGNNNGKPPESPAYCHSPSHPNTKQFFLNLYKTSPAHPPAVVAMPRAKVDSHARSTDDLFVKSTPPSWRRWAASAVLFWRWARNPAARRHAGLRLRESAAPRRRPPRSHASRSTRAVPRASLLGAQSHPSGLKLLAA